MPLSRCFNTAQTGRSLPSKTAARLGLSLACWTLGTLAVSPSGVWAEEAAATEGVKFIANPAASASLAPRLTVAADSTPWLSWLQATEAGHELRIAEFRDGRFTSAQTVASGSDWFINWADTPHLFVGADGWMAAHWLQKSATSTYAYDVKLSYSNDGGSHWSTPVTPHHDGTPTEHGFLSFYPRQQDPRQQDPRQQDPRQQGPGQQSVGMVWLDGRETGGGHSGKMTLRGTTLTSDGRLQADYLLDGQVCDCCQTDAVLTRHGAVVTYRDRSDDEIRDIYIVHQTKNGWSEPVVVHKDGWQISGCPVNGPQLVSLGDEVAVIWYTMAENIPAVQIARSRNNVSAFDKPYTLARSTPVGRVASAHHNGLIAALWVEEVPGSTTTQLQLAWLTADSLAELQRLTLDQVPAGRASGFPNIVPIDGRRWLAAWTIQQEKQLAIRTAIITAPGK